MLNNLNRKEIKMNAQELRNKMAEIEAEEIYENTYLTQRGYVLCPGGEQICGYFYAAVYYEDEVASGGPSPRAFTRVDDSEIGYYI